MNKPLLPRTNLLVSYLERIDTNRYYSNFGPLVMEYERRLSEHFNCGVVSVASCTTGLTACLLAQELDWGSSVEIPSWTFPATAAAICGAGLFPRFVDVDKKTHCSLGETGIMVSPFGAPINKVSAIVDAAAGFDTVKPDANLTVISTHCTKVFGTGEGGLILSTDLEMLENVREIANFGFSKNRNITRIGLNAKMSEYHAAVGLAELDGWAEKRIRWLEVKDRYERLFSDLESPVFGNWASSQFPIVLECDAVSISAKLGYRRIWGDGVHSLVAYEEFPSADLPMTEYLAAHTLFLPMSVDLTKEEQEKIATLVEREIQ